MATKKSENILAEVRGKTIKLADGKDYTLAPLNLNLLANLEAEFDCDLEELGAKLSTGRVATAFRKLLWLFLRDNYPELKEVDVGRLVEVSIMTDVVAELTLALEGLKA